MSRLFTTDNRKLRQIRKGNIVYDLETNMFREGEWGTVYICARTCV